MSLPSLKRKASESLFHENKRIKSIRRDPASVIPVELIFHIFSYIKGVDRENVSSVSRQWYTCMKSMLIEKENQKINKCSLALMKVFNQSVIAPFSAISTNNLSISQLKREIRKKQNELVNSLKSWDLNALKLALFQLKEDHQTLRYMRKLISWSLEDRMIDIEEESQQFLFDELNVKKESLYKEIIELEDFELLEEAVELDRVSGSIILFDCVKKLVDQKRFETAGRASKCIACNVLRVLSAMYIYGAKHEEGLNYNNDEEEIFNEFHLLRALNPGVTWRI